MCVRCDWEEQSVSLLTCARHGGLGRRCPNWRYDALVDASQEMCGHTAAASIADSRLIKMFARLAKKGKENPRFLDASVFAWSLRTRTLGWLAEWTEQANGTKKRRTPSGGETRRTLKAGDEGCSLRDGLR